MTDNRPRITDPGLLDLAAQGVDLSRMGSAYADRAYPKLDTVSPARRLQPWFHRRGEGRGGAITGGAPWHLGHSRSTCTALRPRRAAFEEGLTTPTLMRWRAASGLRCARRGRCIEERGIRSAPTMQPTCCPWRGDAKSSA